MCTGTPIDGVLISAALSGAGMYLQKQSADSAANKQQRIIRNAQEETDALNTKKANTVTKFAADTFNPESRDASYEEAAANNESSLVDALTKANGLSGGEVKTSTEGNVSDEYTRRKAQSTLAGTADILNRARLLGRSNAGGLLFNKEQLDTGNLRSDVAGINSNINRTNNYANTALNGVRDQGSLVGGLLMGIAPSAGGMMSGKQKSLSIYGSGA